MGVGNHDFDDGIDGLAPFADLVNFPLLAANLIETPDGDTTEMGDRIQNSTVIDVEGVKVGIIGYITSYTPDISNPDSTLTFLDEIESVRAEAKRLKVCLNY